MPLVFRPMLRVAAYALALCISGCLGAEAAPPDERPYVEARGAGVGIELPEGWHPLNVDDGNITDPRTQITIASGPLRGGGACDTQVTRYAPDGDNVALVVLEWKTVDGALPPPRPAEFDDQTLPLRDDELECFGGDGGTVQFVEHGRVFGVYVLVGEHADDDLVAAARGALETLRVTPRGS
jgi:hypothetical protein